MKHLLILTIGFCLLLTSVPAMADQAADEAAIRELMKQMKTAYNKKDAKVMASCVVENFETWDGERKGRVEVSEYWASLETQGKQLDEIGIIFVTPGSAILKVRDEYTGADSKSESLLAWVLVKENGKWLFAALFTRPIEQ